MAAEAHRPFRHQSPSIAPKQHFLTVDLTVKLSRADKKFPVFKCLRLLETIEWGEGIFSSKTCSNPSNFFDAAVGEGPVIRSCLRRISIRHALHQFGEAHGVIANRGAINSTALLLKLRTVIMVNSIRRYGQVGVKFSRDG